VGIAREKDMDLEFTLAVFCCKTANQANSSSEKGSNSNPWKI
jgi:hypothetical protein